MEITGRIIVVLPAQGGTSQAGNVWKKQEYVLETHDQYPRKVHFQIFGEDKINQAAIQPGEEVTVHFDIDSREYNGRWYTNISAWRVDRPMAAQPAQEYGAPADQAPNFASQAMPTMAASSPNDDLPF